MPPSCFVGEQKKSREGVHGSRIPVSAGPVNRMIKQLFWY